MDCDLIDEEFIYGRNIEKIKRKKELILDSLRNVVDPDLKKDIVELNFIRNLQIVEKENKKYDVEFDLNLTTPACPVKEELVEECRKNLDTFDWVESLKIHQTFENFESGRNGEDDKETSPNKIENVILIYSCKGGVGKSFFSVNFSFYLKKKGASVGILDADINGPSLSTLLPFDFKYAKFEEVKENERGQRRQKQKTEKIFYENDGVLNTEEEQEFVINNNTENINRDSVFFNLKKENGNDANGANDADEMKREVLIEPLIFKGVKLMSYSYIKNKGDLGFAPFRGAILNELIHEFINHVNWGVLNYLIIDMPPGTSDMHLNLMDGKTHIDGTIIITTPNELAINDVQKSINMCNYFNIPIISLIVNMSYFICDNCNKKHYIFNSASVKQVKNIERSDSTSAKSAREKTKVKSKYSSSCSSSSGRSISNSSSGKERGRSEEKTKGGKKKKKKEKEEEEEKEQEEEEEKEQEEEEDEEGSGDNLEKLKRQVSKVHEIPFHPLFAKNVYYRNGEKKFPFLLAYDDHFLIKHLENVFENIVREISILKNNDKCVIPSLQVYKKHFLQLSFDTVKNRFVFSEDVLISHIRNIRMKCKCEICKLKNKKLHKQSSLWNPNISVKEIKQLGVYNVKIIWSDNHISVYSYSYLKHLFMKINQTATKKIPCYDATHEQFDW